MSVIQQHSNATLSDNWRTINIDALDPESSQNFDLSTLYPAAADVSEAEVKQIAQQVRQLLRGGDAEGALRGAMESAPWGASSEGVKSRFLENGRLDSLLLEDLHLSTVTEVLQSIKASDMTPMLQRIFASEGGAEVLDTLMKYLYKGMSASSGNSAPQRRGVPSNLTPETTGFSQAGGRPGAGGENSGTQMSVLLSWHEKVVDVAGLGCIGRTMSDRRRV